MQTNFNFLGDFGKRSYFHK